MTFRSDMRVYCLISIWIFCFTFSLCDGDVNHDAVDGYYWREYFGCIPKDAIEGGIEKGKKVYIGQAFFEKIIVPAKIIDSEKTAYFEWGFKVHSSSQDVKILCSNYPERFNWVKATSQNFRSIKNKHFVIGGYENGATLYVGRINVDGELIVGKLLVNQDVVLHAPVNGTSTQNYSFEVLYYDPGVNVDVDVRMPNELQEISKCTCVDNTIVIKYFCN